MTRTQRFLLSILIVVSVPVAVYLLAPAPTTLAPPTVPPEVVGPPERSERTLGETPDLSGRWQGLWDDGAHRLVYSLQVAHRRPEDFIHATGTVMHIRKGYVVDSILTLSLGGRVVGDLLELGAPPPWTRQTVTGSFAGRLSADRQSAHGEVMGLDGSVLPLRLRLVTPALNRAEGAYALPDRFSDL